MSGGKGGCPWGERMLAEYAALEAHARPLPEGWTREVEPHLDCAPAIIWRKAPSAYYAAKFAEHPEEYRDVRDEHVFRAHDRGIEAATSFYVDPISPGELQAVVRDVAIFASWLISFCEVNDHQCCGAEGC